MHFEDASMSLPQDYI